MTIPLNSYFQRVDEVKKSRLIFQLLTRVNRDIFTKKELRRFNKEIKPTLVFGLILFCSINFLEAISSEDLFSFANSEIFLIVVSPIDLFGTFIILSKDRSSFD